MSSKHDPQRRLAEIFDLALDEQSNEWHQRELESLLLEHPELAPAIALQLRIHGWLQWDSPEVKSLQLDAIAASGPTPIVKRRWASRPLARAAAAAAAVLCIGVGFWFAFGRGNAAELAVAEIVDDRLVAWGKDTDAVTPDGRISAGRVAIDSGTLTLRFRSGATLRATGPASLNIKSDMLVELDEGQATAHVPHWAIGFTVQTPSAAVVDLGTEFGVAARTDGKTDVIVFDGEVDLTSLPQPGGASAQKRLTMGEAVSVSLQGGIDRIFQVQRNDSGEFWSTAPPAENACLFREIDDNLRGTGSAMCYQITPGGFDEDALAYVDRPHQWNGMTTQALPDFLQRADYVRTFNQDKYTGDLEIVVKLARPAWLYILFDDRVPPPEWLKTDFEDTGVDVGLDEGPWIEADVTLKTAVGSGNSVDRSFSVWRKKCDHELTIRLGALGVSPEARAMYGIVATPL